MSRAQAQAAAYAAVYGAAPLWHQDTLRLVVFAVRNGAPADVYGHFIEPDRMGPNGWAPVLVSNNPDRALYCAVDWFKPRVAATN